MIQFHEYSLLLQFLVCIPNDVGYPTTSLKHNDGHLVLQVVQDMIHVARRPLHQQTHHGNEVLLVFRQPSLLLGACLLGI
ncbi:hypothetical protein DPMN_109530 [Dreissena polymorpha]|uniref:Uncharacterized protein n=1 Tax=Dreissena polymorpha TaxID=45954 RepID=A0A9D4QN34_DREPO|nr:hypothetical protein DPMN_109530 [Dreissena polymorpha]